MIDIIKDVSYLSGIPEKYINKIVEAEIYAIVDAAAELNDTEDNVTELNIGFGTLYIKKENDSDLKFKFIPSQKLEKASIEAVKNEHNLLTLKLEASLKDKLISLYKDLL